MCGIAGVFAYSGAAPPVDPDELLRLRDAMARRGPDGAGAWMSEDARVGLAHRRLAVIDTTAAGAQPMATPDRRFVITFNGEIYNYRELRRGLEAQGCVFRSNSDTEVLLHLFARRGPEMVHALRGMYAFAIWDALERVLLLARDPFGIKPLYLADDGKTLRFASQVKALLKGSRIDTTPDPAGAVGFFIWGAVPDPHTLYEGIRALPAGTRIAYRVDRAGSPEPFFRLRDEMAAAAEPRNRVAPQEVPARLREALVDSVRHHLVADVPVAVFLSSGLDSTTLTRVASETSSAELLALTLGFAEHRGTELDEVPLAEEVAACCGVRHETHWISRGDFESELPTILDCMDQPTIDGVNAYFVSRAAARAGVKVALSGLGGDELLGGYPSFRQVPRLASWLRPARAFPRTGRAFRRLTASSLGAFVSPKYTALLEYGGTYAGAYLLRRSLYLPWELDAFLDPTTVRLGLDRLEPLVRLEQTIRGLQVPHQRVAALELEWYMRHQLLRDADWAGMAHSVEIRVPLVDVPLFRALAPLMSSSPPPSKRDLAAVPKVPLPSALYSRRKTGFATPVRQWTQEKGSQRRRDRGLRGWARMVNAPTDRLAFLALVPDAFGGHGGIALYNRDLLGALASLPECGTITAVPRLMPHPPGEIPASVRYVLSGLGGKPRYAWAVGRLALGRRRPWDLLFCCHINLLPLAALVKRITGSPLALVVYGIEAWSPTRSRLVRRSLREVDWVLSISDVTLDRFLGWAPVDRARARLLPNAIHPERYGIAAKRLDLLRAYGLLDKTVLLTLGRMASSERYKGFDEVLETMPRLLAEQPDLAYLAIGDGPDRARLQAKALALGIADRVVFAGPVSEAQKADHYRLADAFVMPSRGEGFGFVFLEALACGIPVVASRTDGGREALRHGDLGILVDPDDPEDIARGIRQAVRQPHEVPAGLEHFSFDNFAKRLALFITEACRR